MIDTRMNGGEIDRVLGEINKVQKSSNNGKVVYVRDGALACDYADAIFDVIPVRSEDG